MVAQRIWAEPGSWHAERHARDLHGGLGLLVLDGVLVRTTQVSAHTRAEIVGPGDLLRPPDGEPSGGSIGVLAHQTAIAGIRQVQARVLLSLWHLADRWGRVTPEGVALTLPLTHQLLAPPGTPATAAVAAAIFAGPHGGPAEA